MRGRLLNLVILALSLALLLPGLAQAARLKDIAQLDGVRDNQLLGYGLVGGLAGTGDDPKSAPYTAAAIANMLGAWGFQVDPVTLKVKNFAAVMVTANLPAYLANGDTLDVTVSSIGTAKSLEGGVLYQTLLRGADGAVYAVAQGQVSLGSTVGGGSGGGGGGGRSQIKTVGRIPSGALIEAAVPSTLLKDDGTLHYHLRQPDFTTAAQVVAAINTALAAPQAHALDAGTIAVAVPLAFKNDLVPFVAALEGLSIEPDARAKVVINQRTGTVVIGANVEIRPVAVSHGTMTFTFGENVSTPGLSVAEGGATAMVAPPTGAASTPESLPELPSPADAAEPAASADSGLATPPEASPEATILDGLDQELMKKSTTAAQVAEGLNKMHLGPADIVAIFEAINAAGALLGELQVI